MKDSGFERQGRFIAGQTASQLKNRAASVGIEASKSLSIVGMSLAAMGNMSGSVSGSQIRRKKSGVYVYDEREGGILEYTQSPAGDIRHVRSLIDGGGSGIYVRRLPKQELVTSPEWRKRIIRNCVAAGALILLAVLAAWAYFEFGQW